MSRKKDAHEVLDQATDKASAELKGVGFSNTDAVLSEFDKKIDEASLLDSDAAKNKK